jgi:hypothetical protein
MAKLPQELIDLIADPASLKIVATTNADGIPHVVAKGSLTTLDGETIAFQEGHDLNTSNKNLVHSIWKDKQVAINITKGPVSYQIKGKPYKCLISGPIHKQFVERARKRGGPDADIANVWIISPDEVINESPAARRIALTAERPILVNHLDRESVINR